jgi:hypothetical protein
MTKDDTIRMAQYAGFDPHDMSDDFTCNLKDIERFAELHEAKVRADERKKCAAICRKEAAETDKHLSIVIEALEDCAYLIEKRGEE